jgi:hypothetical protein
MFLTATDLGVFAPRGLDNEVVATIAISDIDTRFYNGAQFAKFLRRRRRISDRDRRPSHDACRSMNAHQGDRRLLRR